MFTVECDWCGKEATQIWVAVDPDSREPADDGVYFTCPGHKDSIYGVTRRLNILFHH